MSTHPEDPIAALERLGSLLERGLLTKDEFDVQKARLLGGSPPSQPAPPAGPQAQARAEAPPPSPPPPPEPPQAAPYWTAGRVLLGLIAVPGTLVLSILCAGGALEEGGEAVPAALSLARFEIVDSALNDDCSRLGEYCLRATCTLANVGSGSGLARVELLLQGDGGGAPFSYTQQIDLTKGQRKAISHDFTEARMAEDYKVRCRVQ